MVWNRWGSCLFQKNQETSNQMMSLEQNFNDIKMSRVMILERKGTKMSQQITKTSNNATDIKE